MTCFERIALAVIFGVISGCASGDSAKNTIRLATTTSTQESGLLDAIIPAFESETGIAVKVIAVGSGQALELGRRGDSDILLTHSPAAEMQFMAEGWGARRMAVMHNDFVILGPPNDEAGIKRAIQVKEAFAKIAEAKSPFLSRGDDSGTHRMEMKLWQEAGIEPAGAWYSKAGSGMAQTLRIAYEKKAYVLCDRATFMALKKETDAVVLFEGDESLRNRYSVITLAPAKHPHLNLRDADRFADYLISPEGQKAIGSFGVERFGRPLFVPDAQIAEDR